MLRLHCVLVLSAILIQASQAVYKNCKNSEQFLPCQCLEDNNGEKSLYCDDFNIYNIYSVFDSLPANYTLAKVNINSKERYLRKALMGSAKVQNLQLNIRGLKVVHEDALEGQESSLNWFELSNTQLSSIPTRVARKLKMMTTFVCKRSKEIEVVAEDSFEGYPATKTVTEINYAYNSISVLEKGAFSHLVNLKSIVLTGNKIQKIRLHSFPANMEMLKAFFFGNNGMKRFPFDQDFMDAIPRNALLDLSKNKFTNLNRNFFREIIKKGIMLSLDGNNLDCDCNFLSVGLAGDNHMGYLFSGGCAAPVYLKGKKLKELTRQDFPRTCKVTQEDLLAIMSLNFAM